VLKGMAHGNGNNWKVCLNLPLISLKERSLILKRALSEEV